MDFMKKYQEYGFFGITFLSEYSHDEGRNDVRWTDDYLLTFFQEFYNSPLAKNTILIIAADHGQRYSSKRSSMKGLLNERNPFSSWYIPDLFKERYPVEAANLKAAANTVIAPMDLHATLMDLIDLETSNENKEKVRLVKKNI